MGMLATWFVLAVVVGVIASNRGRSGFGWFVLSALISPLIGLILVLALRTPAADPSSDGLHKQCLACAEWVKRDALKCKHCGESLNASASGIASTFAPGTASASEYAAKPERAVPSTGAVSFGTALGRLVGRHPLLLVTVAVAVLLWAI